MFLGIPRVWDLTTGIMAVFRFQELTMTNGDCRYSHLCIIVPLQMVTEVLSRGTNSVYKTKGNMKKEMIPIVMRVKEIASSMHCDLVAMLQLHEKVS